MTFKTGQHMDTRDNRMQQVMAPNGQGMNQKSFGSSTNFGDRATNKTLKEMTNPFLSKMYSQNRQEMDSNIYSYDPSMPFHPQQ
jgi:spore coat protein CotH